MLMDLSHHDEDSELWNEFLYWNSMRANNHLNTDNTDNMKITEVVDCADDDPCPICYSSFCDGSLQVTLPCGHVFHLECISNWAVQNRTCPMDRSRF